MWFFIIIAAAVVAADQLTKILVMNFLELGERIEVIPGVFNFTYILNDGMAFGLLDEHRWIFMSISVAAIAALIYYLWRYKPESKLAVVAMALIAGGGIGNMIDRLFYGPSFGNGAVVDFLDFCAFGELWKWIFNVADACVCVGAGLCIFYLIKDMVKTAKEEKAKENEKENA